MTGSSRLPAPAPPWRAVIATTIRLWWQRRITRRKPGGKPRSRTRALRLIVSLLVIALVVVSVTAIHLAQTHASAAVRADQAANVAAAGAPKARTAQNTAALQAAAATRQRAASWIAGQVGRNVIVACDPLMCTALQRHGFPAANLNSIGPGSSDTLGTGIVVSTPAVRDALGSRLTAVYAPVVIASFGSGQDLVQVLVTAPDGAAAYEAAGLADLHARQVAGQQLLHNKNLKFSPAAAQQLTSGQVDSRLLMTLPALARQPVRQPVRIISFGDGGPGAAYGVPLRAMAIRSAGPRYLQALLSFLRAQHAPLLPRTAVSHQGKAAILHIEFPAPSPNGLLTKT